MKHDSMDIFPMSLRMLSPRLIGPHCMPQVSCVVDGLSRNPSPRHVDHQSQKCPESIKMLQNIDMLIYKA